MKKLISLILSIMMLATFMPMMALAETTEDTTDIKTSMGLDYTPYEANPGDTTGLKVETLLSLRKDAGISSGNNTNRKWTETKPYVRVDLGRNCEITGFLAFSGGGVHYSNCSARYSLDKKTWYDLSVGVTTFNGTASSNTYDAAATYAKFFKATQPVTARYLEITNYGNNNISRMYKLNIYGTYPEATRLSAITLSEGTLSADFDPDVTEYEAEVTAIPTVSATAETEGATVTITQATAETKTATITVSYEGEATKTYTINFTLLEPISVPTGVTLNDEILYWSAVEESGATYVVNVYNNDGTLNQQITQVYGSTSLTCYLSDFIETAGTYKITVQAKVEERLSEPSAEIIAEFDGNKNLALTSNGGSGTVYNTTDGGSNTYRNSMEQSNDSSGWSYLAAGKDGYLQINLAEAAMIESCTVVLNSKSAITSNYGRFSFSADGVTWFDISGSIQVLTIGSYHNHIITFAVPVYAKHIRLYRHQDISGNWVFRKFIADGKVETSSAIIALDSILKVAPVATDATNASYDAYDFANSVPEGNTLAVEVIGTTEPVAIASGTSIKVPAYLKISAGDKNTPVTTFKLKLTNTADGSTAESLFSVSRKLLEPDFAFPAISVDAISVAKEDNKVKATITVTNDNISEAGSAVVFVAIYKKDGTLLSMKAVSPATTISGFAPLEAADAREVEIDAPTEAGTYVAKAFVWKDQSTLVPFTVAGATEFTID